MNVGELKKAIESVPNHFGILFGKRVLQGEEYPKLARVETSEFHEMVKLRKWLHVQPFTPADTSRVCVVKNCARCGHDHEVIFRPLRKPSERFTHWSLCPTTTEPIVCRIVNEPEPHAESLA